MKNNKNSFFIAFILLLLVIIGICYAYLTSNLSITGITEISGNSWNIHFTNVQVLNGSVNATTPATIDINDNTKVNYTIRLNKPGDYYEFTVDVVNSGTIF